MRILIALLLFISPALADDHPKPLPIQQAMAQKLLEEIQANIQLRAQIMQKDREIEILRAPKEEPKEAPKNE